MFNPKIPPELRPILESLLSDGYEVYTYVSSCFWDGEINSLFWYENGRMLNIQPSTWRNSRYARDLYQIGVSYIPSRSNGSGCGLSPDDSMGTQAKNLLQYRNEPTWVIGIQNYSSVDHWLKLTTVLTYFQLTEFNL